MIIDTSMTLAKDKPTGTAAAGFTTDPLDLGADGGQIDVRPWIVLHMKTPVVAASATGTLKLLTCDTEGGSYKEIAIVSIPNAALTKAGLAAKLQFPPEGLLRYIKAVLTFSAALTTAGTVDLLVADGVELGL